MNAISLLCKIIAQGGKVSSSFYDEDKTFAALIRRGFLREVGVVGSVVCGDCDAAHSAPVVYEENAYGYFCPDLGLIRLDPARVTAFSPDVSFLINQLADVFECRQRKTSSILDQTWRIGTITSASASVVLYFHPTLQTEKDTRDLLNALGREARSEWRLVVTSQGRVPLAGLASARLDELVEMDASTGKLIRIADPSVLAGVPRKNPGGRPSEHGDFLKPLIEDRIRSGEAAGGINAEFREVRAAFHAAYPEKPVPSDSAIKRHIRKARGGS